MREFGTGRSMTYDEWLERSGAVAGGLAKLGVERGDRVALMLTNRLEFHVVDMGAVLLGAAPFSLYNTAPVEQLLVNVDNAEPAVLIAEAQFADRAREVVALRPQIKLVVLGEDALEEPGFDVVAERRGRRARRPADARLHLGHDRPAEGRAVPALGADVRGLGVRRPPPAASTAAATSPTCRWRTSPSARSATTRPSAAA